MCTKTVQVNFICITIVQFLRLACIVPIPIRSIESWTILVQPSGTAPSLPFLSLLNVFRLILIKSTRTPVNCCTRLVPGMKFSFKQLLATLNKSSPILAYHSGSNVLNQQSTQLYRYGSSFSDPVSLVKFIVQYYLPNKIRFSPQNQKFY